MASVGTTGAARDKDRSRPHLPTGRCWVSGRALNLRPDVRPSRAPAPALTYGGGGKGSSDPTSGDGELLGPHAPSALLELSSLDPGLGARAQDERRAASIARGSRRTRSEKRSGWDSASVGHLVCLVQACVKGLYLYLYLFPGARHVCTLVIAYPALAAVPPAVVCVLGSFVPVTSQLLVAPAALSLPRIQQIHAAVFKASSRCDRAPEESGSTTQEQSWSRRRATVM